MDLKSIIDTRRKGTPDLVLFLIVIILMGIGIAMSYSASAIVSQNIFGDSFHYLKKQLLWCFVGFIGMLIVQEIDYKHYIKHTKVILILSFLLLIIILIPGIGQSAKGSVRWIDLGIIRFQPSEFVKVFVVIYLSKVFSAEKEGAANHMMQILIPIIILAVVFMLILLQPDFGTAVDLLFVSVAILFVSGFPIGYILMLFIISIPAFYLLIYQVDYRRERFLAYLNPWEDRFGNGYHIIQSFIAFKKGALLGVGLGYGTQKLSRLPEPHTDFVFAVIAEEAGFFGTLIVVILFLVFFWRGIKVALDAPDNYGRLLAMGLTLLITVQAFVNIGVVTGSLPTTGIPLPFISYGGSSLLATMISVGVLLNISRYRDVVSENVKLDEISGEVWSG